MWWSILLPEALFVKEKQFGPTKMAVTLRNHKNVIHFIFFILMRGSFRGVGQNWSSYTQDGCVEASLVDGH